MATNEELEKRIESLEKEVKHLKAVLQYQMRSKNKWHLLHIFNRLAISCVSISVLWLVNFPFDF